MAKVVNLYDTWPGGWKKARWAWIEAVIADGQLNPMARLVAVVLAQGFANHKTAECRPGLAALMQKVASSRASVMRALADLKAAGWLEQRGGEAPGRAAGYAFRRPEPVSPVRPEPVSPVRPEPVSPVSATGLISEISPCTPYKDKPNMNHKCVQNDPETDRMFAEFWGVHPRPSQSDACRKLFLEAVHAGEEARSIVSGARQYAKEQAGNKPMYVCRSDNWLKEKRWRDGARPGEFSEDKSVDAAEFWAKAIKAGKYIPPSAVSPALVRDMLARGLVDQADLVKVGVRA